MKFYIEPIGDKANEIIAGFLNLRGDTIENTTMNDVDGRKHSVYITSDHNLITCLKNSKNIKLNKDFRIYIIQGGILVQSYIDQYKK